MASLRIALLALAACLAAHAEEPPYSTPGQLAAHLTELHDTVNAANARSIAESLPPNWNVQANRQTFTISTVTLKNLLTAHAPRTNQSWPMISEAKTWLEECSLHLGTFEKPSDSPAALAAVKNILSRPEFSSSEERESAWDRWKRQMLAWIGGLLARIFGAAFANPTTRDVLFWAFLFGGIGLAAYFLIRLWRAVEKPMPGGLPEPMPDRGAANWVRAARVAAESGDLRRAIQCAYWAAIAHLEETSALTRDAAKTPREYLSVLTCPPSGKPLETTSLERVQSLTIHLERHWYAGQEASREDFADCLHSLEALGCQVA
jgi:Domain of unknown function (DUF4129)